MEGKIGHERKGVAGGYRGRVHRVDKTVAAAGNAHAGHGFVVSGAGIGKVADGKNGIRGIAAEGLGRNTQTAKQKQRRRQRYTTEYSS